MRHTIFWAQLCQRLFNHRQVSNLQQQKNGYLYCDVLVHKIVLVSKSSWKFKERGGRHKQITAKEVTRVK